MKLGIGLPNTMAHESDRTLMLEWARLADEAGFHVLGTIDKPNYDSWDPLVTRSPVNRAQGGTSPRRTQTRHLNAAARLALPLAPAD